MMESYNQKCGIATIINEPIYVVTRGYRADVEEVKASIFKEMSGKNDPKNIEGLQKKLSSAAGSYGGAFYANGFKVDKAIDLMGVSFFGPANGKPGKYYVSLDIYKSKFKFPDPSKQLAKIRTYAEVDTELFWITFFDPILVLPGIWYTIQFCLDDGPATSRCVKTEDDVTVNVGGERVEFIFLQGSMQMPHMKFRLAKWNPDAQHLKSESIFQNFCCC